MGGISVGPAISAGFRLIGREPAAFLVWCLVYLVVTSVPAIASWSETSAFYEAAGSGDSEAAAQPPFGPWQWISLIVSLVAIVCLTTAAMRATLHPDERRFFYLQLGARELWFALTGLVLLVLGLIAYFGGVLVFATTLGAVGAGLGDDGAMFIGIFVILLFPVMLGLWIWIWVRMSMATTMAYAEKRVRVFSSWRFTKGHGLRIFLVALSLFVVTVVALLMLLGGGLALLAATVGVTAPASLQAFYGMAAEASLAARLVYAGVFSAVFVAMTVIGAASWAEMYRQLRPSSVADTFS